MVISKNFIRTVLRCMFVFLLLNVVMSVHGVQTASADESRLIPIIEVHPGLEVEVGEEVLFSGESSIFDGVATSTKLTQGARFEWDFGDGYDMKPSPESGYGGMNTIHYFMKPGTFTVKLTVLVFEPAAGALNPDAVPIAEESTSIIVNVTGEQPIEGFELLKAPFTARLAQYITAVIPSDIASVSTNRLVVTLSGENTGTNIELVNKTALSTEEKFLFNHTGLPADDYRLVAEILDANGNRIRIIDSSGEKVAILVEKFSKPYEGIPKVGINELNAICVDGEPFFPVNVFWLPKAEFDGFAGCNNTFMALYGNKYDDQMPWVERWKDYLTTAGNKGCMVSGPFSQDASGRRNTPLSLMESYVSETKDYDEVLLWAWWDEPNINNTNRSYSEIPPTVLAAWTYATNREDPTHPVTYSMYGYDWLNYYNQYTATRNYTYRDSAAVFGGKRAFYSSVLDMDIYPFEARLHASLFNKEQGIVDLWVESVDNFINRDFNLIPHGIYIQTCDGHQNQSPPPTNEKVLMLAWLGVTHGVKQVTWFPYHVTGTRLFDAMREFTTAMNTYGKIILGPDNVEQVTDDSNIRTNRVDTLTRKDGDYTYLFAVRLTEPEPLESETNHLKEENIEPDFINTTFTVPDIENGIAEVLDASGDPIRNIIVVDGEFRDIFGKEEYRIYRIRESDVSLYLTNIPQQESIKRVSKGKEKTAEELELPTEVMVETNIGNIYTDVIWNVEESSYDPFAKVLQVFPVNGTVILPGTVANPNGLSLNVSIMVTVFPKNVWTAKDGFDSTQGANQWYYYWLNGTNYVNMVWSTTNNRWERSVQAYVYISEDTQVPVRDVARAWKAPEGGTIRITGNPRKVELAGNGVQVTIKKNDTILWGPEIIEAKDGTGIFHDIQTDVNEGDFIYFVLNNNGHELGDTTYWNPTIELLEEDVNRPPVFEEIENKTVKAGSTLEFTIQAADSDGDDLVYTVEGLPEGAAFDPQTRTFTWTPQESQKGDHDVTFIVEDGVNEPVEKIINIKVLEETPENEYRITVSGPVSVNEEETFDVVIGFDSEAGIIAADIKINYDADLFEYVNYTAIDGGLSVVGTEETGILRYLLAGTGEGISSNVPLIKLTFKAKTRTGSGDIDVTGAEFADAADEEFVYILPALSGIAVEVESIFTGDYDFDDDGFVNVKDLAFAAHHYGKTSASSDWNIARRADSNRDNIIDILDLVAVAMKILGK